MTIYKCSKCKKDKPASDFHPRKTKGKRIVRSWCKDCSRADSQKRHQAARDAVWELKRAPCTDCGKTYNPWQMQFDHVKGKKEFEIQKGIRNRYKLEKMLVEIAKCELVCANCHADRTYLRLGYSQ